MILKTLCRSSILNTSSFCAAYPCWGIQPSLTLFFDNFRIPACSLLNCRSVLFTLVRFVGFSIATFHRKCNIKRVMYMSYPKLEFFSWWLSHEIWKSAHVLLLCRTTSFTSNSIPPFSSCLLLLPKLHSEVYHLPSGLQFPN
jgi:hypothetical protein